MNSKVLKTMCYVFSILFMCSIWMSDSSTTFTEICRIILTITLSIIGGCIWKIKL